MATRTGPGPAVSYGAAVLLVMSAAVLALVQSDSTTDALASLTRQTARLAFLFFFVTFTASVWLTWRPLPLSRWLMRHRRHLGLSFASVHFVHLGALASLFAVRGQVPEMVTLLGGGLAYVLLLLMVLTSNRASRARLGRGWRVLHLTGCWYLWLIFTQSYLGRLVPGAGAEPYGLFVVLSVLALAVPALRTWAWLQRRARKRNAAAGVTPGGSHAASASEAGA